MKTKTSAESTVHVQFCSIPDAHVHDEVDEVDEATADTWKHPVEKVEHLIARVIGLGQLPSSGRGGLRGLEARPGGHDRGIGPHAPPDGPRAELVRGGGGAL